jgi:hypothetical protein
MTIGQAIAEEGRRRGVGARGGWASQRVSAVALSARSTRRAPVVDYFGQEAGG